MIDQKVGDNCTGCKMCADICPKSAITFINDQEGFWIPKVDYKQCNSCKICLNRCPSINKIVVSEPHKAISCYGAWHKNPEIRNESTSGGFFSAIAEAWLENGGNCIGAIYDDKNVVKHIITSKPSDLQLLRQSKYVQSDTSGIFRKTKHSLDDNQKVLFCGTPCQVAALQSFLKKDYDNLITVDFICYGIPSPLAYQRYLEWLEKKYQSVIRKVWFKNKREGWRSIGSRVDFENGKSYFRIGTRDLYMIAFVVDALDMRKSCHNCQYRVVPHYSDITMGDFWGVEYLHPEFDDNKGISAVIINTVKGKELFEQNKSKINYFQTTIDEIAKGNYTMYEAKEANPNRDNFLRMLQISSFEKAMERYSSYVGFHRFHIDLSYAKYQFKVRISKYFRGKREK